MLKSFFPPVMKKMQRYAHNIEERDKIIYLRHLPVGGGVAGVAEDCYFH